ncbi:MAG TPA: GTP cyclohydrolase I FolE [Anaerolineales bacterium]|nr:GTP cyclohydrolase I FolE [Anaerolineales bacterium]
MTDKVKVYEAAELLGTEIDHAGVEEAVSQILRAVGEDPTREGLRNTPERIARSYDELLAGYRMDPLELLNDALFDVDYDDMVLVRDIEFFSLCEHHMLPFMGRAHIAYIPQSKVVGLSKIPRIVDLFSRRLQVQERMTRQISDFLCSAINPLGAGVVVEALHMCSMMRGVKKHDARMTTSTMVGSFRSNPATRQEFLDSISRGAEPLHF